MKRNFTLLIIALLFVLVSAFGGEGNRAFPEETVSFYLTRQEAGNTIVSKLNFAEGGIIVPVDVQSYKGVNLNAAGYYKGFIWMMGQKPVSKKLYKLMSDGSTESWEIEGLPSAAWKTAVVDGQGMMYLTYENSRVIYKVNLEGAKPQLLGKIEISGLEESRKNGNFGDLLIDPKTDILYGWYNDEDGEAGGLYKINTQSGKSRRIGSASKRMVTALMGFDKSIMYAFGGIEKKGSAQDRFLNVNIQNGVVTELNRSFSITQANGCQFIPNKVNKNGLQYFGVVREKSKVNIFWQVAASENNKYFEVQRSINGSEYQTIAVVYAKDAETFGADYSFTDQQFEKLDSKKFWYRVKRVDPLGLEYFSAIKEVDLLRETKGSYISIHPNPFNTTVQVKFESEKIRKVDLRVTTEKGLIMVEDTFQVRTGYNNVPIEAEYLIPGIYFIEIRSEGTLIEKLKVVKQ
jgi:hypothetical protein